MHNSLIASPDICRLYLFFIFSKRSFFTHSQSPNLLSNSIGIVNLLLFAKDAHEEFELPRLANTAESGARNAAGGPTRDGAARSPMPGVVEKVHVKAGDSVFTGQPLVVIMAMKMEVCFHHSVHCYIIQVCRDVSGNVVVCRNISSSSSSPILSVFIPLLNLYL